MKSYKTIQKLFKPLEVYSYEIIDGVAHVFHLRHKYAYVITSEIRYVIYDIPQEDLDHYAVRPTMAYIVRENAQLQIIKAVLLDKWNEYQGMKEIYGV